MFEYKFGGIVTAKAGHDKGEYYVIIKSDGEYVYLADGIYKTIEKPKKKNIKHVQFTHYVDENLMMKDSNKEKIINEEIKRAIKLFKKSLSKDDSLDM
ncbi:MAG: hypothetical protein K0R21_2194 [Anaerocolumna sp.]|jgi:ribosomal protein L14E/L6E/L27E|nr:hypothetical protein [Anaerocolumna sp.]